MAAAVLPVHQPRLWSDAHLVKQAADRQTGHGVSILAPKTLGEQLRGSRLQLVQAMGAAPGAHCRRLLAEQAPAGREAQGCPVYFLPPRFQHIHVKQPAQGVPVFQRYRDSLQAGRRSLNGIEGFVPGGLVDHCPVPAGKTGLSQLAAQQGVPPEKGPANLRPGFHRPGNVHGKADHWAPEPGQQGLLPLCSGLPGLKHIRQSDWVHKGPPDFSSIIPNFPEKEKPRRPFLRKKAAAGEILPQEMG